MQYQGQIIPTQEAPPRPGMLRAAGVGPLEGSRTSHGINGTGGQWDACLERLETGEVDRDMRPRKSKAQQHRIPGARQKALWENVQQARLKGLSIRGIARELGIHRNTARKYALAESPPLRRIADGGGTSLNGHVRRTNRRTLLPDINTGHKRVAMLTLDRTLLTLVVPVLVFVAITGCASGADDTPSEDKSGGVFERLLAVVPDSPYTREGAYMNDYLRARDAFGIPLPGHDADEDDLLDYIIKLTVFDNDRGDGYMMADGPEFSGFSLFSQDKNAIRIENLRHLAFDIRHVEQSVTVGGGTRNQLELVKGSFDPDDSRQALDRCDRCPPPDRQEHMGVEFYSWGEGHLDNRWLPPAFDGLGRGGRIAVLDSFVLRTSETAGIKALIDVHVGNIPPWQTTPT